MTETVKPILEINNLKKRYRLGSIGRRTLVADWQAFWDKRKGREDPRIKLGKERLIGQTFMALNGINLKIYPGEAVGIIGINGAGKSTMLKLISRITGPTEGEIIIRGKITSMLEVGTGFDPELTGRENIYMNGTVLGMKRAEIDAKMEDIINFSEVRDFIDTPVKRYSSGMFVKLAFSVAAHLDSDIMIMDEVLAVGDAAFQKKCLTKMSQEARSGKTVLYVSHNMSTIRQLCTRVVVLKEGKVIYDGDVEEGIRVYSNESFNFEMRQEFPQPEFYPESQRAAITAVEILDKTSLAIRAQENLKLKINMKVLRNMKDAAFSFTPRYAGSNPAGSFITVPFNLEQTDSATAIVELNTESITPGKYFCDMAIGNINMGRFLAYEEIKSAFGFEVIDNKNQQTVSWQSAKWGYAAFPSPDVIIKED